MTEPSREPRVRADLPLEHLAAYLDGTLPPSERAATERLLAASPEAREVLADAMRLLGYEEDAEEEAFTTVSQAVRVAPRGRRWLAPALAAAAVVAVSLVPILRSGSSGDGFSDVERLLRAAPSVLEQGWDSHAWTVTRSEGSTLPLDRAAFRAGVRWTDALVAWQAGARADASGHFAAIGVILDGVPLGAPAARVASELRTAVDSGRSPDEARALLREGRERLGALLPAHYVELGAWIESVRLAARAGATEFLHDPETLADLDGIDTDGIPADAAASLAEVRATLQRAPGPEALAALSDVLDRLLAGLGG